MNHDALSISRTTSVSRTSRRSSVSRSQSLIKKNIAPHDLRPSDVLIERFVAWKAIVKQLIAYFEGIADIENYTAKELVKLSTVIQVPFRAGNQFLGEGGLQDIYYGIRDKTKVIADQHANLGRTIDGSIVQHLQKLRTEIKAHIKNIQNDTGKLATSVAKERELSARYIGELATNISVFKNSPMHINSKSDPYVANQAVVRQLNKQVHEENLLQKSIIIIQQSSAHFEESLIRSIQSAWATYDEWLSRASVSIQDTWRGVADHMNTLQADTEWISFSARSDHLLDPETPLRNPEAISYPSKEDPSVLPVHVGLLERKKRYTRTYKESYWVLTPAGFLHEYASSDPSSGNGPIFSLFLPMCTLGPPSDIGSKSHKFHIEGKKDGMGTTKGGSLRQSLSLGRSSAYAWSFRARSHDEMNEWWNDIRMLCARYLVASESMDRGGPVQAAVRSVGYETEEGESMSDEDEGSSVEEEEDDDELYGDARENAPAEMEAEPPGYDHGEVGANGYLVDKKPSRRPSKRQQEKAPEGRHPNHVPDEVPGHHEDDVVDEPEPENAHAGPAPVESRFQEQL